MRMPVGWRYLLALGALALICAAAYFNQAWMFIRVIEPLTRLSWLVSRTLAVIGQDIYWIALIFVITFLGLRLIPIRPETRRLLPYNTAVNPEERAAAWERLIRQGTEDDSGRKALLRALNHLNKDLAEATGESAFEIDLPPVPKKTLPEGFRRQMKRLQWRLAGGHGEPENEIETRVREILNKLETTMERENEG